MNTLALIAAGAALLGNAALAGLFYGFSMAVMPGLDDVGEDSAAAAMRSIDRKILNPWLYLAFTGAPLASAAGGALVLAAGNTGPAIWLFAATALNVVGSFVLTIAVNVPMNNALDADRIRWSDYAPRWTRWNTARAVACFASVLLIGASLLTWTW